MINTLSNEKGFTLLELLTVVCVVGILASIAVQQLTIYQVRTFDARAEHDLRTAITAQEAYYVQNEGYLECDDFLCQENFEGFVLSDGTKMSFEIDESGELFSGEAYHPKGEKVFRYTSDTGIVAG